MSRLDAYVGEKNSAEMNLANSQSDLDALLFRIKGCKTKEEIQMEVDKFIMMNNPSPEVQVQLQKLVDEGISADKIATELEAYMTGEVDQDKFELDKSEDAVKSVIEDEIFPVVHELQDKGVEIESVEEIAAQGLDTITSGAALDQIVSNLEKVADVVDEVNEYKEEAGLDTTISLDTGDIIDSKDSSDSSILADDVVKDNTEYSSVEEMEYLSLLDTRMSEATDGSLLVDGDLNIDPTLNFTSFLAGAFLLSDDTDNTMGTFDMSISKDITNETSFITRLSDSKNSKNTLNSYVVSRLNELSKSYNGACDYNYYLMKCQPELALAINIAAQNMNATGIFAVQMINDGADKYGIVFSMDENRRDLVDAFQSLAVPIATDQSEINHANLANCTSAEQEMILKSTYETMEQINAEKIEREVYSNDKVKKIGEYPQNNSKGEAANIGGNLLVLIILAEMVVLTIGAYCVFK